MTFRDMIMQAQYKIHLEATINYIQCCGLQDTYDWEKIYFKAIYELEEIIMAE